MITIDKIKIYKHFNGDPDYFAKSGSKKNKSILNDNDWYLIDRLILKIHLINKNLVSDTFMNLINNEIKDNCDNEETIQALKELV